MDDVFKYHRVQGRIREILRHDKVRSADIGNTLVALGTDDGKVHILNLDNPITMSFKAHDRPVNDVSVDSNGLVLASCSDSGTVVIQSLTNEDDKGSAIHFNEPIKCVVVDNDDNPKKDKSVIIGTVSGKLIHYKQVWFTHKNVVLFNGNGSPVISMSWRGDVVAWADLNLVRIMNISTQSAVCYLSAPTGVGIQNPFPCHFFWENDTDLFISWADSVRHLEISKGGDDNSETIAKTIKDYQMDCITCGISTFDADNLVVLGYIPPDESAMTAENSIDNIFSISNRPELKLIKRSNGDVISCDTIPMMGQIFQGPWDYQFLSSFMCPNKGKYSKKWQISNSRNSFDNSGQPSSSELTRSSSMSKGYRTVSPLFIVISPEDIIVGKVRDVNDRIGIALQHGDLLQAANLAAGDRTSLRHYHIHDIITLYIEDLLDREEVVLSASECARLVGTDPIQWEQWVHSFIKRGHIKHLLQYIPVTNPRLPKDTYELVLETFFQSDTSLFLKLIESWGRVKPPIFDHLSLIQRLEASPKLDPWAMEGLAQLYLWSKKYEKALNYYLEINYPQVENLNHQELSDNLLFSSPDPYNVRRNRTVTEEDELRFPGPSQKSEERANFIHVYELIEKENLYAVAREKIINLFRLSKELSVSLLARNVDKFPVSVVVRQLKQDKRLLYYYLHYLFVKYDAYNNDRQYSEFHVMQVSLYAEFAPKFEKPVLDHSSASPWGTDTTNADHVTDNFAELIGVKGRNCQQSETQFMTFLRTSKFYPLDYALRECEKRKPPLYPEMVYILDLKGQRKDALNLLLREIGDMHQAVDFIEKHEDVQQPELWNDLVEYCIKNHSYLASLLDYLGICNLNAVSVVSSIPLGVEIPSLRNKILRIIRQYHFQVFLTDKCNMILEEDALDSLKRLKQGQRRAMKVTPATRCSRCAKPLFMNPSVGVGTNLFSDGLHSKYKELNYQLWGKPSNASVQNGVVVFSPRVMFHRLCYDHITAVKAANSIAQVDAA